MTDNCPFCTKVAIFQTINKVDFDDAVSMLVKMSFEDIAMAMAHTKNKETRDVIVNFVRSGVEAAERELAIRDTAKSETQDSSQPAVPVGDLRDAVPRGRA